MNSIRNFCIIAHIDHGKSTLADRLLEITGTVDKRNMKAQLLDKMDLEREKGITIKLAPVRMNYKGYELNLIDTPGHVDFSYEVSRSLQACEGALLIVDASQGIQAQTLANVYLALGADLKIIPVLNKIDLPAADPERVTKEVVELLGCDPSEVLRISAKTGEGVEAVLEEVIKLVPEPITDNEKPLKALIFDSFYDEYRGVILYVRAFDGNLNKNDYIHMMASGTDGIALEVGCLSPEMRPLPAIQSGEIGYIVTNLKSTSEARVGDTVTLVKHKAVTSLEGYKEVVPFVYAGFFGASNEEYQKLKEALDKLSLSDSALVYTPENSPVLGFGFRIGFLGMLHLDIVKERLEREYDLELVVSNPSTDYKLTLNSGEELDIKSASEMPDQTLLKETREPWINGEVVCPKEYVGAVIQLIVQGRGVQKNINFVDEKLAIVAFEAPLANMLTDFYDKLKSITSGYGSFNYDLTGYRVEDLVRVDFYIAGDIVEPLSIVTHRSEAQAVGRETVAKLKEIIPRQNFQVALQAAIGGKFIAREDVSGYRKDVTAKLYGGDVTRRKKLLEKQKKGKDRMKRFGKVDLPAEVFTVMMKRD